MLTNMQPSILTLLAIPRVVVGQGYWPVASHSNYLTNSQSATTYPPVNTGLDCSSTANSVRGQTYQSTAIGLVESPAVY